ncbi:MAG TPA: nucleotidyltransferase domain-containing protein [Candidatus Bathyarchaeia archaeon]|nr:nucleotidyltransferase domain-containing protein [Candidatus Bathyarchaeia archaeon]
MSQVVPARLPKDVVKRIDQFVKGGRYANRSEAIKDAARRLVESRDSGTSSGNLLARLACSMIAWNAQGIQAIVLYGSIARTDAGPESDIDLLVIIDDELVDWKVRRELYKIVYPIIPSFGLDISLIVINRKTWTSMVSETDPLAESIRSEGIVLWGSLNPPS